MTSPSPDTPTPIVHLYVLLDRSGSMASMADDVIGGFNTLLAEQQGDGADARMTLVQFDTEEPHHVIADAVPIAEMIPLTARTFVPRGGTPLLDATGLLLTRAIHRAEELRELGQPAEQIVIATITDGHENQSTEHTLATIRQLVEQRTAAGWTFVFLGAGLDAYGDSVGMGIDQRSIQAFAPDGTGAQAAFTNLSGSAKALRAKTRAREHYDNRDFFEGNKTAEADRKRRKGS
jgi:Mg-chelatase subunit ChlD